MLVPPAGDPKLCPPPQNPLSFPKLLFYFRCIQHFAQKAKKPLIFSFTGVGGMWGFWCELCLGLVGFVGGGFSLYRMATHISAAKSCCGSRSSGCVPSAVPNPHFLAGPANMDSAFYLPSRHYCDVTHLTLLFPHSLVTTSAHLKKQQLSFSIDSIKKASFSF